MKLRLLDLQSFDETVEVPDRFPVSALRDLVQLTFGYDLSCTSIFHGGRELAPDGALVSEELRACPLVTLFNSRIFPQKSYPKVDHAFRFFPSRYQEFAFVASFAEDAEPPGRHGGGARRAAARDSEPGRVPADRAFSQGDGEEGARRAGHRRAAGGLADAHAHLEASLQELRQVEEQILIARRRLLMAEEPRPRAAAEDIRAAYGLPDEVELTRADFQALRRLEGSGVDRPTIASIYIACDRNEAVAQNCLMSME
jgi:hypothetical protein